MKRQNPRVCVKSKQTRTHQEAHTLTLVKRKRERKEIKNIYIKEE